MIIIAKIERTKKGKRKNAVANVFVIILAGILVFELCFLAFGTPGFLIRNKGHVTEVTFGKETKAREDLNEAASIAISEYSYARIMDEKVARYDVENGNPEEFMTLVNEATNAWRRADEASETAMLMASELEQVEGREDYDGVYFPSEVAWHEDNALYVHDALADAGTSPILWDPLAIEVQAKSGDITAKDWAQQVVDDFDKFPAGKKIRGLATTLNTDAKHAYVMYQQAVAILEGADATAEADAMNRYYNGCKIAATAGKVAQVGLAIAAVPATGGTSLSTAIAASSTATKVGLVIGGADALVSVANTTCDITLGSDHTVTKILDKTEEFTAIASSVNGAVGFRGASNADKLIYLTGAGADASQGKILGGTLSVDEECNMKLCTFDVYDGKKLFDSGDVNDSLRNMGVSSSQIPKEMIEKMAEDAAKAIEVEAAGQEFETSKPLSELSDAELEKAAVEHTPVMSDEEIEQELRNILDDLRQSIEEEEVFDTDGVPLEEVVTRDVELEEVLGEWDVEMTMSNIQSDFVELIVQAFIDAFSDALESADIETDDVQASEVIDYEDSVTNLAYISIEQNKWNNVYGDLNIQTEDGDITEYTYTGKFVDGTLYINKVTAVNSSDEGDELSSMALQGMEFDAIKYGNTVYLEGTCSLDSFILRADIDYYGAKRAGQ